MKAPIFRHSISELSSLMKKGELSAEDLTLSCLERIQQTEDSVRAFITLTADLAISQARAIDRHRAAGEKLSPLAGIPFGAKDNICTNGIATTCASRMLYDFVPPYDATVIDKLKRSGAILLGKLNMDEFAMGSATDTSSMKITNNPLDTSRVAGGSSGGSAAAVAAGDVVFSLGSDTGGSVRQPCSFCGTVGIKPTYGSVSRYGLIAFAPSFDQIGPITSDVYDNALVLSAIAGRDKMDSTSCDVKYNYLQGIDQGIKGMRIGLALDYLDNTDADVRCAILSAAHSLEGLGAHVSPIKLPETDPALAAYYVISSSEACSNLARFDGVRYGLRSQNIKSVDDLFVTSRTEGFGQEIKRRIMLGTFALSQGARDEYYRRALSAKKYIKEQLNDIFMTYDAVILPVSPTVAYKREQKKTTPLEIYMEDMYCVLANLSGLPSLSMPCGTGDGGMPVGMQIMGSAFSEPVLYRIAYAFENTYRKEQTYEQ